MAGIRVLVALVCFCLMMNTFAQVKESVVVVRPIVSELGVSAYLEVARFFKGSPHTEEIEMFENLAKSQRYYSGFLVNDGSGGAVVLTDRHGVVFSDTVEIVFLLPSGDRVTFEDCPVVYKDPDVDVAIIRLSGNIPAGVSVLDLWDGIVVEGQQIWAAGYVTENGRHAWRSYQGTVTNTAVVDEHWGLPSSAVFLQHTATLSGRSIGGPLVLDTSSGQRAIGLNSWWFTNRQNASFAVPTRFLRMALDRMPSADFDPLEDSQGVQVKAQSFAESLTKKDFSRFLGDRLISASLGADKGWFLFKDVMTSTSNPAVATEWNQRFYYYSAGDTMKHLVWYHLYRKLHAPTAPQIISTSVSPESRTDRYLIRTELKPAKGKAYWIDWGWECGNWCIFSTNAIGPSLISK